VGGKILLTRQNKDLTQKLATSEANNARMVAAGSETKNYGKGEMQKTPTFTDNIDSVDSLRSAVIKIEERLCHS